MKILYIKNQLQIILVSRVFNLEKKSSFFYLFEHFSSILKLNNQNLGKIIKKRSKIDLFYVQNKTMIMKMNKLT